MNPTNRVALRFIRNYTAEPIEPWLRREFAARGLQVEAVFGGFAEAAEEVRGLAGSPARQSGSPTSVVVLTQALEQYSREFGHAGWQADEACANVLALARAAIERCPQPLVLNTVLPPPPTAAGFAVGSPQAQVARLVAETNLTLRALADAHPGRVVLLDWEEYARELGAADTYDRRFWYSSGLPFGGRFMQRFAADLAAVAEVLAGRARKCLVLDCDNTLWGGIVGEDGPGGIALSPDTAPGMYFQEFQRVVLDYERQGVLIALCSRNNEADVLDVLDRHPHCLIRREHLATWRIDWNDKAASIAAIAAELNIGLDALVFVDDSPHECERIRGALPDVRVLARPERVEALPQFLQQHRPFPRLALTAADAGRTASYHDNRKRAEFSALAESPEEYRRQLGIRMRARVAVPADLDRIAQLFQKTNQFNLTTVRHGRADVDRLAADPDSLLFCADVGDKFGDLGLVAVACARREGTAAHVESFLLSCRALGRDVEFGFLAAFVAELRARWMTEVLHASYVRTAKNVQVADFWTRAGFMTAAVDTGADERRFIAVDPAAVVAHNRRTYIEAAE